MLNNVYIPNLTGVFPNYRTNKIFVSVCKDAHALFGGYNVKCCNIITMCQLALMVATFMVVY